MTEDQIERRVERMMDHLDRVYLNGDIDTKTYHAAIVDLNVWAEAKRKEHNR